MPSSPSSLRKGHIADTQALIGPCTGLERAADGLPRALLFVDPEGRVELLSDSVHYRIPIRLEGGKIFYISRTGVTAER